MKHFIKLALVTTIFASTSAYAADKVVGKYNNLNVTTTEVMNQYRDILSNQAGLKDKKFEELDKNIQETIVKSYINNKLMESEAKAANIESTPEYKAKLGNFQQQLASQIYIENYIKNKITEESMKKEYENMKKELEGKEEVKAKHILVEKEETAKEVKQKLDKGAKFEDLAKQYSTDEASKTNGGELGYFPKGQLVPEFEAKAFSLKKGQVSTPVKTQFGWHIIKVEDRRPVKVPTFDEAKPIIQNKLSREIIEKLFEELNKKANVTITIE